MTFAPRPSAPRPADHLVRAALAVLRSETQHLLQEDAVVRQLYPGDAVSALLVRAATSPASLTSAEWAGALASTAVADFVGGLGPVSAAAQLIATSLQLDLGRYAHVRVPGLVPTAALPVFVGEGREIPVNRMLFGSATLGPTKVAVIVPFTREAVEGTAAEAIVRTTLRECIGLSLDAAMFSALADVTGERPAGLLHSVTPLDPTAGGGNEAMIGDLVKLATAVAPVAGLSITFVASPDLALKLALRGGEMPYRILSSFALAAGTILAVANNALAVAIDPAPEMTVSKSALLHMDTAPSPIGTAGSPPVVAAPAQSMYQVDALALRCILGVSYGLRAPGAVAVIDSATW
jgi:hypothetical protein